MHGNNANSAEIILVVDDEPVVLSFLTGTLSRYGYRVVQAESGAQAIRVCRDRGHSIDLILTDVVMPGLNGRELVDAIRNLGLQPRTLFMSGYSKDVALHTGMSDWAHFIQKPFTLQSIGRRLREVLRGFPTSSG